MTQPLVEADAAAAVAQAPRFVSAAASAQGASQAMLWISPIGWALGVAILIVSEEFEGRDLLIPLGIQLGFVLVAGLITAAMGRRGAQAPAAPMPAGVLLVPRTETRRMMFRSTAAGMLIGLILLAALAAGSNPTLLGGWSAALFGLGLGQRVRARAFLAREVELQKSLWIPERRTPELPRLVAGKLEPEITRES